MIYFSIVFRVLSCLVWIDRLDYHGSILITILGWVGADVINAIRIPIFLGFRYYCMLYVNPIRVSRWVICSCC